jgi:DHA1 family tetracycline resistance protein-like MFS transporter
VIWCNLFREVISDHFSELKEEKKLDAIEAATNFVAQTFPTCDAAFLAGSVVRGEATATSDLDIVIVTRETSVLTIAHLRWPLLAIFFYYFPFASMGATLTILLKDSLGWNATAAGMVATAVGVVDILVQGVLVGKLLTIFSEVKVSIGSLVLIAASYILVGSIVLIASPLLLIVGVILFAGASGLVENALRGLTSRQAGPRQQGLIGGASQSMQSLAMILGSLFSGLLYVQFGHSTPYWSGALIIALAIGSILLAVPALRTHQHKF